MIKKLDNIPLNIAPEDAIKRLAVEEAEDIAMITELFNTAKGIAKPKALYREVFVEEISGGNVRLDNICFTSGVLAMNLKNIHRVFAYVCTCGTEVDDWSHAEKDYIVSLWLDMIKEMFLHQAVSYLREYLEPV